MLSKQKQAIEAYQRVQEFLEKYPAPAPASYDGPRAMLDDAVAKLTSHSVSQVSGVRMSRAETKRQKALRTALRKHHLRPIHKIARAMLKTQPGIDVALKLPRIELSITRLVADATAIRNAAAEHQAVFTANGRPADFLEKLDGAIAALKGSLIGRASNIGTKAGAKAGLAQEIVRGRNAVEMLDAIVATSFADDAVVLAEWRSARRVQQVPGGTATVEVVEEDPSPDVPAAA